MILSEPLLGEAIELTAEIIFIPSYFFRLKNCYSRGLVEPCLSRISFNVLMFFCRSRNQRISPEISSYRSQAHTPPINIKIEPSALPSLPSDSLSVCTETRTLLKRRKSSTPISQMKLPKSGDTKYYNCKAPLKKHRSTLSGTSSPKAARKILSLKSRSQEAGRQSLETLHKEVHSKTAFDPVDPLLSVKSEMKVVDELKARRDRLLRAIEQKCEDDCREEMKPCCIMLRLEIMHAKLWVR